MNSGALNRNTEFTASGSGQQPQLSQQLVDRSSRNKECTASGSGQQPPHQQLPQQPPHQQLPQQLVDRSSAYYAHDSPPFEVTIISDFVCAWCMIGKRSLEVASKSLGIPLRCVWQPYIINPNTPPEGENVIDHLVKKFGTEGAERFLRAGCPIDASAARVGLQLNLKRRIVPSLNAHRLVEWCKTEHAPYSETLVTKIFDAYYEEGVDISNIEVLAERARRSGLNPTEAYDMLISDRYKREVFDKDFYARNKQRVSGVPSFTITYRTARKPFNFSGAQPPEVMVQFMLEASKVI